MAAPEDYSGLLIMQGHAAFYTAVHAAVDTLRADGSLAQAKLLEAAFETYFSELRVIGEQMALKAHALIVRHEHDSRVRPDTEGNGGPRLQDYIGKSDPLPQLPGSAGINDEQMLQQSPVSWWWTNEEGYSGFIGREIQGFFFAAGGGAGFIPSSAMAGQHPIFKPYGGKAPTGIIDNPIPARKFVEEGFREVEALWHGEVGKARAAFIAEFQRIMALPVP